MELEELAQADWSTTEGTDAPIDLCSEQNLNLARPFDLHIPSTALPDRVDAFEL